MKDRSYGVIPLHGSPKNYQVLLIQHQAGHWSFPKGHPEAGEEPRQTAQREMKEETGLETDQLESGVEFEEKYSFQESQHTIQKSVIYYLGWVQSQDVQICKAEIKDFAWLSFADACKRLTFKEGVRVLNRVKEYLNGSA